MNANQVVFLIQPSGKQGTKVVKVSMGRSKLVALYRGADRELNRARCVQWLERATTNEYLSDNDREAAKAALRKERTTAASLLPQVCEAGFREACEHQFDEPECLECHKPLLEGQPTDKTGTMHFEPCAGEYQQRMVDQAVDRAIEREMFRGAL